MVDGAQLPRCIWRATDIGTGPPISVDDRFAYDEGEGDRSRDHWLAAHRAFFVGRAAIDGFAMHDAIATVFERFTLVWPPDLADR